MSLRIGLNEAQIEDLNIPFTAVATDLTNQKEVWFSSGSLEEAIRASCAIPSLLQPVVSKGRVLVDGGVLNPLPIAPSVATHAEHVIAVDLSADVAMPNGPQTEDRSREQREKQEKISWLAQIKERAWSWAIEKEPVDTGAAVDESLGKLDVMYQMFETMQASLTQYKVAGYRPDLVIRIPKSSAQIYEFYRAEQQIRLGYEIALDAIQAYEAGRACAYGQTA